MCVTLVLVCLRLHMVLGCSVLTALIGILVWFFSTEKGGQTCTWLTDALMGCFDLFYMCVVLVGYYYYLLLFFLLVFFPFPPKDDLDL